MGRLAAAIVQAWPGKVRLLPVVMGSACLLLGVKTVNIVTDVGDLVTPARAAVAAPVAKVSTKELAALAPAAGPATTPVTAAAAAPTPAKATTADVDDSVADTSAMSRSEIGLLQELSARRSELKQREAQLDMRERLLQATEKRIDGKIVAVKAVEVQIKQLTEVHDQQQDAKLKTLIKVYETMKPQDAARILEKLDPKIMMSVVTGMSERKIAPVLAAMNPDTAKTLTTDLATRQPLPTIDPGS